MTAPRPRLRLELFGGFTVRLEDGRVLPLPTRKAQALLAFLALPPGRRHTREKLTALLWGDTPDAQARQAFRQALSRLRRALGHGGEVLVEGRVDVLALQPAAVWTDAVEFETLAAGTATDLERAAELYVGDFLEGFAVDEAPFEEWLTVERERLRELALETLAKILANQMRAEAVEPAIRTALRMLAIDPLQEAVHRALMRLHLRQGRRPAALRQYQACVASLQHELGAEPEEETRSLYRQIVREHGGVQASVMAPVDGGPLVARAAESVLLTQAFERSFETGGRVVTVSGEAGIGKTRLVQELVRHALARGCRVLSGACHETEQALPLRPWVDALRAEGSALAPSLLQRLNAGARAQLVRVFPELATADQAGAVTGGEQGLLFEAVTELLIELASDGSTMIVLEDMHWADAASARLLAFLARRLGPRPVLVVATFRPEETLQTPVLDQALAELRASATLDEVKLGPLSHADTLALARGLHRRHRDPGLIDRIGPKLWKLSEGNPFVVVETIRALDDDRAGPTARQGLLPRTVHESIASRLARLSEPVRRAVAVAAVIGRAFVFPVLAQAAALEEAEAAAAVEELVRRRVLGAVGEKLEFCHDRIRRVAYDEIIPARRAQLHAAVARALGAAHADRLDEITDQLGQHYLRAGEARPALVHLKRFAEIATQRYELEAAVGALRSAADAVDRLPGDEQDHQRLDVALRQAFVMALGGRQRECLDLLAAHAPLQQRVGDPALTSEYFFRLAMTHAYLGNHGESRRAGASALAAAEQAKDDERTGKALYALAAASYSQGASREAIAYGVRAVPLLDHPGRRHWLGLIYWNQAANRTFIGELDAALDAARRCAAVAEGMGDRRLQALSGFIESWVHAARGDHALAIACARRAQETSREPITATTSLQALGNAFLQAGDAERAVVTLEEAVEQLRTSPIRLSQLRALAILAEAYLLKGDVKLATQTAQEAVEGGRASGNLFNLALAERTSGRIARATGAAADAEALFARALENFQAFEAAFESAMTRLDLARSLAARGARADARAHLASAIRALDAAGAPRRVAEARELARSLTIPLEVG